MTLHIFNPEHDLALAANLSNFTPPLAARTLRRSLGYLPAFWAKEGDAVLVDDVALAEREYNSLPHSLVEALPPPRFVADRELRHLQITSVDAWGWDRAVARRLLRHGIDASLLPDEKELSTIRQLSSRECAANVLSQIKADGMAGEAYACTNEQMVNRLVGEMRQAVLKAPWSSSGRGIRRVADGAISPELSGWVHRVLQRQGAIMVEPFYQNALDFGMEFASDGSGGITFLGLSIFTANEGRYAGNVLAPESCKRSILSELLSEKTMEVARDTLTRHLSKLYANAYKGPFGVDMMAVKADGSDHYLLHPCVEINLRRTMGHVALCASKALNGASLSGMMRIDTENDCKLRLI